MNTQQTQAQTAIPAAAAENTYFDSVLYARAYINEVKLVESRKKGKKPYCAVNASIVEAGADGKIQRKTIDLIVRGLPAKQLLWRLRDRWLADINVGSIRVESYRKRDGSIAAVLKGRLINIRALRIGGETVHGELAEDTPRALFVAPCCINEILPAKGRMKVSALDGEISDPAYFKITLDYGNNATIAELLAMGIQPKGYQHCAENPKVFAILEIAGLEADVFTPKSGEPKAYAKGKLGGIRYLKADSEVIVDGKKAAAA